MYGEAVAKADGGKLVRIKVSFSDNIDNVEITGDFFLDPAECLYEIENSLKNSAVDFQQQEIIEKINEIVKMKKAEFVGMDSETISKVLREAIENGKMASNTS